ncbi:MAG: DeoR/GlpR family DNA-binding transcription regulator [Anaerolineales bacterium]|jgi:DeoR family fructose operon transcriptional repressor
MVERLIPAQRRNKILNYLQRHKFLRNLDIVDELGVSEATIRRDLDYLEKKGLVERTHGGALLTQQMRIEPEFSHSVKSYPQEKQWIGYSAAQLVQSGDTVFIGIGTTTSQISSHLRNRVDLADVTIVTNNIVAALEIESDTFDVILVGGSLRRTANSLVGRFATEVIDQIYANKTFIGADGLSFKYGCTSPVSAEAETTKRMIERTHGEVILVADHSKWGVVSNFHIADIDSFHTFITDRGISKDALSLLDELALEVIIAGPQE